MNILISNDDGVFAPGILAAKQAVEDIANVTVVAPNENNSSVGRRLTLFKHLKLEECELEDGSPGYSLAGSPADRVVVGENYVMDTKPDLVISGINQGVNISSDITSSGTVCAALEAVSIGIPAIRVMERIRLKYKVNKQKWLEIFGADNADDFDEIDETIPED